jgi:hypothetical protein
VDKREQQQVLLTNLGESLAVAQALSLRMAALVELGWIFS